MRRSVSWSFLVFCYSAMVSSVFGQPCADIKPLVCSLSGFNPDPTSTYTRPPEPCTAAPDAQKQKIQDAFSLAPDKVKLELCRLKAIFVVPITDADYNWG